DVFLPDGNGLEALPKLRSIPSSPEVIIITGLGDHYGATLAIKNGAWDYIQKPSSIEGMTLPFLRALEFREAKQSRKPIAVLKRQAIVGNSPEISNCLDQVAQVASSDITVLITGETGTGKELFAWAIHNNSARVNKSFVVVDCTAIPENLVESTLFGYEKGAFTGADKSFEGLIKQADGGTLFLDEVGELPLSIQKVFLRVLQERRFRPLRGGKEIQSDFRLVAATNRDLTKMVEQDLFRNDLLFRLQSFTIELPPLKERPEDIQELAMHYITDLCRRYGSEIKGFSSDFFGALTAYSWPGNVRELFHALEGAFAAARHDPILFPNHLSSNFRIKLLRTAEENYGLTKESLSEPENPSADLPPLQVLREEAISKVEKQYLLDLLSTTGGNIIQASQISGLSRARLYGLLKKYSLSLKS
ncbi:MAG: Fis family transcriptional regulator, partial [Desulfobacca sp.]|nr:Fis family transcriptional regulator [Desulfobacca sp.]